MIAGNDYDMARTSQSDSGTSYKPIVTASVGVSTARLSARCSGASHCISESEQPGLWVNAKCPDDLDRKTAALIGCGIVS